MPAITSQSVLFMDYIGMNTTNISACASKDFPTNVNYSLDYLNTLYIIHHFHYFFMGPQYKIENLSIEKYFVLIILLLTVYLVFFANLFVFSVIFLQKLHHNLCSQINTTFFINTYYTNYYFITNS